MHKIEWALFAAVMAALLWSIYLWDDWRPDERAWNYCDPC
jgi:hypothetical protein